MKSLYFSRYFYWIAGGLVFLFMTGYVFEEIFLSARIVFFILLALTIADIFILFLPQKPIYSIRFTPDRLSNGDENEIRIYLENKYSFQIGVEVIDEIPAQFQKRDISFQFSVHPGQNNIIKYYLRPVKRGEYTFGSINTIVNSPIRLVRRRFRFEGDKMVPVYPSYLDLHKFEIMAISQRLTELGIKKVRRLGHNMEFEQIKEYVPGDDYRTINWKATARKGDLMVNTYQDEKSQQVYCIIDKGRSMRMPFDGMTLLDHSINASLVLSNVALKKDDKAGIITFQHKIGNVLPASKRNQQMSLIQDLLYNQKTAFKESDFSRLFRFVHNKITQRSLLLLFSNFETVSGLERQLTHLRKMAKSHVLVVIFFKNTQLNELVENPAGNLRGIYHKAIAEKYIVEKKTIQKMLGSFGIYSILTAPENLNVDTINKYLELKARGII